MNTRQINHLITGLTLIIVWTFACSGLNLPILPEAEATHPPAVEVEIRPSQPGTTYYVRPDGGSYTECTGTVDAAYSGSGEDQPCAWNHPFQALPPGETSRILGGDTLIITSGSYQMGYGAPGAENCEYEGSYEWVEVV